MRATADWPGDDPAAIALAARISMLSAASKTCTLGSCSEDQSTLLSFVEGATKLRHVRGQPFATFLESAKGRFERHVRAEEFEADVTQTLRDVAAAEPVDLIGQVYDRLVELASEVYGKPLAPTLSRNVVAIGESSREFAVRGRVRRNSNEVELLLYTSGFDLAALALTPRILAHELICHVAAGHTDAWPNTPVPDVRAYFSDGFMDRATWRLLMMWLDAGELPNVTAVGQLSVKELEYNALRPIAFKAGMAAFDHCLVKTTERVRRRPAGTPVRIAQLRAESEDASIRAALRLNTCGSPITQKDWFVHDAKREDTGMAASFARVAAGEDDDPSRLFATADRG